MKGTQPVTLEEPLSRDAASEQIFVRFTSATTNSIRYPSWGCSTAAEIALMFSLCSIGVADARLVKKYDSHAEFNNHIGSSLFVSMVFLLGIPALKFLKSKTAVMGCKLLDGLVLLVTVVTGLAWSFFTGAAYYSTRHTYSEQLLEDVSYLATRTSRGYEQVVAYNVVDLAGDDVVEVVGEWLFWLFMLDAAVESILLPIGEHLANLSNDTLDAVASEDCCSHMLSWCLKSLCNLLMLVCFGVLIVMPLVPTFESATSGGVYASSLHENVMAFRLEKSCQPGTVAKYANASQVLLAESSRSLHRLVLQEVLEKGVYDCGNSTDVVEQEAGGFFGYDPVVHDNAEVADNIFEDLAPSFECVADLDHWTFLRCSMRVEELSTGCEVWWEGGGELLFRTLGASLGRERTLFSAPSEHTGRRIGILALGIFWLIIAWILTLVEGAVKAFVPLHAGDAGDIAGNAACLVALGVLIVACPEIVLLILFYAGNNDGPISNQCVYFEAESFYAIGQVAAAEREIALFLLTVVGGDLLGLVVTVVERMSFD